MLEEIESIKVSAIKELQACSDSRRLAELKSKYLGRKGQLTRMFRAIADMPAEQRPIVGKAAGEAKKAILEKIKEVSSDLETREAGRTPAFFDVTLPGRKLPLGRKHPLTLVTEEIIYIFHGMGFSLVDGPEVETEYYNFDALNTPADHPSRDIQDTFYLENGQLLRTHTSPVQIRVMEKQRPPVRIIHAGRCYRRDTPDATHSPNFHQVEGLYVDTDVTMADLKGVLTTFARQLLGRGAKVRLRPHFFPFTEPSVEYDFSCVVCEGKGCKLCEGTGWLEIAGAGMVDPNVFEKVGYDAERYSGFAFGMGIERIAMIKYGIDDVRLFYENDLRFVEQF
ncbi:MAG TPA: phenylalanine--tRNA ligase subunit alpha [Candidatus Latescibacteria bacterium]|nr:phenylalanine--tRNA ligase subunit alpha [Candidatus Latescibacterota bacterium]